MGIYWYPNSWDEQLHMIKAWNTVLTVQGLIWDIPPNYISQLANDAMAAETILDKVKSGTYTPADKVQCNYVFYCEILLKV
jgi:hypothetical protein